ncbi:haloacid dehalogenase superfamily, subfamily IA, variant 3 with third motif having DD or ED/haloacid dehalogenase superfamily, subfamily IA, variant 1 with third motif having Dx(3-4)D or Dx(3-4)E [Selenomonas ruminantium]|uniref:Haloacid dehalogenase superfamily, subfamily IA, variant 3 with third motif having DD or ED/haloacid dehalogenase superfamily, subfamily IA, variant 1 with third motif having Dx(3-4)D or Dx(3-4)E n=1 Tax=Selenomonas ruminantium TaxID=971 RepID=A0A1I3I4M0_SELRU|nr:haloacid dehalogenase superfamily, subfamily IA, variant 3 with third motif having DD or ED/haloacid dehalogenase superfamily, subfamily IA, variant 1 with third motif having Dx(3-4)D or Dx(3-4)E [Selenomonas ruminantium]
MQTKAGAFIFDMDGVIIDSEPIHSRVKMDTFQHFGLEFQEADLIHYMGRTSDVMFGEVIAKSGRTDITPAEMAAYKHQHYLEVLQSGTIEPVKGTVELIRGLHAAGIPLALATSSWQVVMETVLDQFGIRQYFQTVLSGGELPKSKPDPAIYRISAERLGVEPARCYVLEDTTNGIKAAKAAGMYCIAFRNPHSGAQDLSLADRIVDDIREIDIEKI